MAELTIVTPDGVSKHVPLEGSEISLGRSPVNELCYSDDTGLSRRHLIFESRDGSWSIRDAGSKNGTLLNGGAVSGSLPLKSGDQISAGHLRIVYRSDIGASIPERSRSRLNETVIFIEGRDDIPVSTGTVSTKLAEVVPAGAAGAERAPAAVGADRVDALIRAGRELASLQPLEELFPLILNLAIDAVSAERGVLLVLEGDRLEVRAARGEAFCISSGVRDRVLKEKTSILVNDVLSDESFREMHSLVAQQVRMFMAVPLQTHENVIGLIYVDCPQLIREFTAEDLNLLTVMANVAAIRIEHARLAEIEQAERILTNDLEQAAIIQRGLLPTVAPSISGVDLAGYNIPCRTVGGDYFDYIPYGDGRIGIALGDVSGKAMPAALLMTSLQARVRVLAEQPVDVADMMTRLNRITAANCPSNRFISFFFCILDPRTGELTYSNAGHNPPMLIRSNGEVELLETGGMILGIFKHAQYASGNCKLEPGDLLVLFSDGVTEAANHKEEQFDEERLSRVLTENRGKPADDIGRAVMGALTAFCAGAPAADDITLVVAKRVG